ncbi:MAG: DUF885 family protein [Edaphobacter sp.]|uniref:DUF885 family protein n=1 Tax=Edaphobacter sp. TaxID=1934404 RepID=UPI00238F9B4D|nr:DUF885 family protein [Edaphobacter sp.]MDE1175368.1 DUF885 family protein [Edaphobacter sp.]
MSLLACADAHAAFQRRQLDDLSESFWTWRATEQPFTNDDIPRIERATDFRVDWSPSAVKRYHARIAEFEKQWRALDVSGASVIDQIDYRLLGSAIARVDWELDVVPMWRENPDFYVQQGLGSVYAAILPPPPIQAERQKIILARLERIPDTLKDARENLTDMRGPYVRVTLHNLDHIEGHLQRFKEGLQPEFSQDNKTKLDKDVVAAQEALASYREWLKSRSSGLPEKTAVGREGYLYFLRNVALLSYSPEQMLAMGRQEWQRSVAFESFAQAANSKLPRMPIFPDIQAQEQSANQAELSIRQYLVSHGILSVPEDVKHYHDRAIPPYVAALDFLGVTDDLTGPSRLNEDSTSYKGDPAKATDFFSVVTAMDTRPLMIHEGVPGHYFQMAWSWHHPDPIRRHYYDSESNEGIGFYAEEMMLEAGIFDDAPRMKESIYSMMRLRALRTEVDIRLALDTFTLEQAADYLTRTVPMDAPTARDEAAMFASTPGQAITYQIGKLDIIRMLSDARQKQGSAFNLQTFHDFVWLNGNVPFALQRWEMLGDASDVPPIASSFAWNRK